MTDAPPLVPCAGCGAELASAMLVCPVCHRLVHGKTLASLADTARDAEERGDPTAALTAWRKALELLPPGTAQHTAIEATMKRLGARVDGRAQHGAKGNTAGKVAGTGAIGALLLKGAANAKLLLLGLVKLPTLLSMIGYASMTQGRGLPLSLGIVAAIYVHEVGHVAALRRYGIEASAPMFVPGFGAFVRMKQYPTDAHEEARTGLAGPLWGLFAAGVALLLGMATGWKSALQVASWSASINLFNLIAVWQLDGARGAKALSRTERYMVGGVAVVVALIARQWMPGVVGAVLVGRAMWGEAHPEGDRGVVRLFLALVLLHPAVVWAADRLGSR